MQDIPITLKDLLAALGRSKSKPDLELTARDLSEIAGKKPPWSYNYLSSVLNGSLDPGESLQHAINTMAYTMDGVPEMRAKCTPVTVFAPPGAVRNGAIILSESIPCGNPFCKLWFVPRVPWQIYCCEDCRNEAYNIKKGNQS